MPKKEKSSTELLLSGIKHWAEQLPEYEWTPGLPSLIIGSGPYSVTVKTKIRRTPLEKTNDHDYVVVKTQTGRIIVGMRIIYCPSLIRWLENSPEFGPIIAHVVLE